MESMGTGFSRVSPGLPAVGEDSLCVCLVEREVVSLDLLGTEKQFECLMRPEPLRIPQSISVTVMHAACPSLPDCMRMVLKSCT